MAAALEDPRLAVQPPGHEARGRPDLAGSGRSRASQRPTSLVRATPTPQPANGNPALSPDGTRIAYSKDGVIHIMSSDGSGDQPLQPCHIEVADSDGSNREALTTGPVLDFLPDWSPDGEWIVFERDAGTSFNLWLMRADGSSSTAITTSGDASTPKWAPRRPPRADPDQR